MPSARTIIDLIADIWRETRRLLVVLWLCRISTASAALALGLAFLPQVQDLYTELTYYQSPTKAEFFNTIKFWATFYGLSFLWAFTVHYCARTILSFESWPLSRRDENEYAYWIEAVPRYLGWVCIIAIFIGQINALKNLQIDDQFLTTTTSQKFITPLIFVFSAIVLVQAVSRQLSHSAILISSLAIIYWLIAAYDIYYKTRLAEHYRMQVLHNLALPVVTILWGCIFYAFVAKRRNLLNFLAHILPLPHRYMLHATRRLSNYFPIQIRPMHNHQTRISAPKFLPFRKLSLFKFEAPSENVRGLMLGLFALTIIMVTWALFAINDPDTPPINISRALLLPVLLSIWVPILTTVSFLSNQLRFPFLTMFVILGLVMSWTIGDNHDIEIASPLQYKNTSRLMVEAASANDDEITTASLNPQKQKLPLKQALELWMSHHNCETTPKSCPAPIIIAASGGASRSAFYVATVLGELHDNPDLFWPKQLPANRRPANADQVASQIFAISSVSGGSLGSAIYAASLRGKNASLFNGLPCNGAKLRKDKLLFSVPENNLQKSQYPASWKNCMQAAAAGDFLSPAMISFAFRDNLAFSSFIGLITETDRAKTLEQAWSKRILQLTERNHLDDPLLSYQPTKSDWSPILLLNGTSVSTGKRLIATPLQTTYSKSEKIQYAPYMKNQGNFSTLINNQQTSDRTSIFTDSLDLHELLSYKIDDMTRFQADDTNAENLENIKWDGAAQSQTTLPDISLSKAISLSARFPFISPHGNLKNQQGDIIDRVVDGGYFDNSGMLTAMELAKAIETISNNAIKPILVQISNHPVNLKKIKASEAEGTQFKCPEHSFINHNPPPAQHQFLPELTAVSSAMLNARVARGSHAIALAGLKSGERFVHFQVAGIKDELGSSKKLSMSWWLSKSVQNALNNQMNWKRENKPGEQLSIKKRLNPAFCAIHKFRKAQIAHWNTIQDTQIQSSQNRGFKKPEFQNQGNTKDYNFKKDIQFTK